ncbi:hypothetical protein HOY80DRAFT_1091600 [Tuber brumale]|nr:hypothetical protein HOY80DRAFT_1091600 [Tuber brumale]
MPIRKDTGKHREATEEEHFRAIELHQQGYSYHEIQQQTGYGKSEVQRIVKCWEEQNTVCDAPGSGRPPKLNPGDKEAITALIESDPDDTIVEITQRSGFDVSERLIGNEAQVQGY